MRKVLVAMVLCSAAAGCESKPNLAEAETKYCMELSEFRGAVAAMPPLDANTQIDRLHSGWKNVQKEYEDLTNAARGVDKAQIDQVKAQYEQLRRTIGEVPGAATLGQGADMIAPQVAGLQASVDQALSRVQCPAVPASAEPERPGLIYTAIKL
ncbi:MAG: hypothetical protein ACREMQ_06835 [Longimicrobiales bacterium]